MGGVGSSWEALLEQIVGMFVVTALPAAAVIAEVDLHIGCNDEALVPSDLFSLVLR